jgi:hypothetical protein
VNEDGVAQRRREVNPIVRLETRAQHSPDLRIGMHRQHESDVGESIGDGPERVGNDGQIGP